MSLCWYIIWQNSLRSSITLHVSRLTQMTKHHPIPPIVFKCFREWPRDLMPFKKQHFSTSTNSWRKSVRHTATTFFCRGTYFFWGRSHILTHLKIDQRKLPKFKKLCCHLAFCDIGCPQKSREYYKLVNQSYNKSVTVRHNGITKSFSIFFWMPHSSQNKCLAVGS